MINLSRIYQEYVSKLILANSFDVKAGIYLESIAWQLRRVSDDPNFIKAQLSKASEIAADYSNPLGALKVLDDFTAVCLKKKEYDIFYLIKDDEDRNSGKIKKKDVSRLERKVRWMTGEEE